MAEIEWKGYDSLKAKLAKLPKIAHDAIWDGSLTLSKKCKVMR